MRRRSSKAPTKGNDEKNNLGNQENKSSSNGEKGGERAVQQSWLRIGILFSVLFAIFAVTSSSMIKAVSWAGRASNVRSFSRLTTNFFRGAFNSPARAGLRGAQHVSFIRPLASLAVQRPNLHQQQSPLLQPTMSSESVGNFDLVKRVDVSYSPIRVSKWRSRVTGLSVVHIDYEAPIVKGYFAVATEIFNDSGCPHTLEHLVFMGSEKYPYKGVLDNLANRAFSAGTNAWTDTDNTVYTIATAGQQGFLQLLPIYVDHILYPTMTQSSFITEVHHVDGKAEDSGVVYSEMQGRENTSGDLIALKMQRTAYPPTSAYRSETGGLMEALRVLDVETIRNYHKSYYVPQNLCLIVAGRLSTNDLLNVLQEQVEPRIVERGQAHGPHPDGWKRPFLETSSVNPPVLSGVKKETVEFPEKDESMGEISMLFMGPPPNDRLTLKAIDMIGMYLTDSAAAPLNKEYVEIPSPYCTYVAFYEGTRSTFSELAVYFGSVPTEHLETLDERFKASIQRIASEELDMSRMSTIIERDRLKLRSALENKGGDVFSNGVINDFIYGDPQGNDLPGTFEEHYKTLAKWTSKQWTDLLLKYYDVPASIVVRAKPSAALADRLESEEKARVEAQRERLGPEGLKQLEEKLAAAKAEHDQPIPESVLTDFPVPDVKGISWISVQSAEAQTSLNRSKAPQSQAALTDNSQLKRHLENDTTRLTVPVQFDHVTSDFTTVHVLMSLSQLPDDLRPYAVLYQMMLFNLPITKPDGSKLTYEDVINALNKDTIAYDSDFGITSAFTELLRVSIKVESAKYDLGIAWLRDLLFQSEFTKDRLEVTLAKVQQNLPELKRDGNTVARSIYNDLIFDKSLTSGHANITPLMEWVPRVATEVKDDVESVIAKLEEVRKIITQPSAFRFSVTGNVLGLPTPKASLARNFKAMPATNLQPLRWNHEALTQLGKQPKKKAVVLSLPTIESSFAVHASQAFIGFDHPDYPALRIALEVLDGTESFLWKYIRGSGLAYGAYTGLNLESGLVSFSLYRSPNSYKAFQEAAKVVKGLCDGSIELKQTAIDAAQSSLVYALANRVSSPGQAAVASYVNQALKGVSQTWEQDVLAELNAVTPKQVIASLKRYVLPIFDPNTSIAVVACAPGKADDIAGGLSSEGYDVERRTLDVSPEELADSSSEEGSESESEK